MSSETVHTDEQLLASLLGIQIHEINPKLLIRVSNDKMFLHHLLVCKDDPAMRRLLMPEENTQAIENSCDSIQTAKLLKSLAFSLARWTASGFRHVTELEYEQRIKICLECKHSTEPPRNFSKHIVSSEKTCGLCGCFLSKKAKMSTETCPDAEYGKHGRWPKIHSRSD